MSQKSTPQPEDNVYKEFVSGEEFKEMCPEFSYYEINDAETIIRLQECITLLDRNQIEFKEQLAKKFGVKEICLSPFGAFVYILTEESEEADNFHDLWIPVEAEDFGIFGREEPVYACLTDTETEAGAANEKAIYALLQSVTEERDGLRKEFYGIVGWDREIEFFVPGRKEPAVISYDIEFHFVEGKAFLVTPNLQRAEYSYDEDINAYIFNEWKMQAVSKFMAEFQSHWASIDMLPIEEKDFKKALEAEEQRKHDVDLDRELAAMVRRSRASTPNPKLRR